MTQGNCTPFVIFAAVLSSVTFGQGASSNSQQYAKQLDWTGRGGCVVPDVHTPCRTVRYHESSFGTSLGFAGKAKAEVMEAFDRDGSESKTVVIERPSGLRPGQTKKMTELVLRKENQTFYIDHERKIFETRALGENKGMPYWEEDDPQCSNMKSHFLYLSGRLQDSVIAGIRVVGYRGRDYRRAEYEVYFAPSIGCQEMRFQMEMRGLFGWKTSKY